MLLRMQDFCDYPNFPYIMSLSLKPHQTAQEALYGVLFLLPYVWIGKYLKGLKWLILIHYRGG